MIAHMCEGFFMKMSIDEVYDFWLGTCHTRQRCAQVSYFFDFFNLMVLILPRSCELGFFHENDHRPSLVFFLVSVSYKTTNGEGFIFFDFLN